MNPHQPKAAPGKGAPVTAPDLSATPLKNIHVARHVRQPVRYAFGSLSPNSVYRGRALEWAALERGLVCMHGLTATT